MCRRVLAGPGESCGRWHSGAVVSALPKRQVHLLALNRCVLRANNWCSPLHALGTWQTGSLAPWRMYWALSLPMWFKKENLLIRASVVLSLGAFVLDWLCRKLGCGESGFESPSGVLRVLGLLGTADSAGSMLTHDTTHVCTGRAQTGLTTPHVYVQGEPRCCCPALVVVQDVGSGMSQWRLTIHPVLWVSWWPCLAGFLESCVSMAPGF